jgi:hypothetical protein
LCAPGGASADVIPDGRAPTPGSAATPTHPGVHSRA